MLLMFDFEDVSTKETSFLCLIIIKNRIAIINDIPLIKF